MKIPTKKIILAIIFSIIILISSKVQAFTITLDPGHGGTVPKGVTNDDAGASHNGIDEKDMNLKIAKYLKEYLQQYQDVKVVMTRENDSFVRVFNRAIIARDNKSDLFVSIHINDSSDKTAKGAEIYVSANKTQYKYNQETTILGNKILSNLVKLGIYNRGVKTRLVSGNDPTDRYSDGSLGDYYGVIRFAMRGTMIDNGVTSIYKSSTDLNKTPVPSSTSANIQKGEGVPTILVEHGFIEADFNYLNTDAKLKKIAEADGKAIVEHYGLKSKKELTNTPFKDVYTSDWYASAVEYTYKNGLIKGMNDTTFAPKVNLTRGMLVTIVNRMEGNPKGTKPNKFTDVSSTKYYYESVRWAAEKGIVSGYQNTSKFGPDDPITRQDLVVILRNYTNYKKISTSAKADLSRFVDGYKTSTYAKSAMEWAVATGVITGSDKTNEITPKNTATRAEVASIIYKYCTKVKNKN